MNTIIDKQQRMSRNQATTPVMPPAHTKLRRKLLPASLSLLGLFAFSSDLLAGGHSVAPNTTPSGGSIVGGSGSILQDGVNTIINQNSSLLALNWQTFNVGANASVLFKQPSFTAVALNRILDQNPSQIFGHINSNGQVFLINTNGIIFGSTAQVNVGGLVASTLDLTSTDFLADHFNLDAHGGDAGVVNHGTIEAASGGSVSLIGGQVVNDGLILANYGHINLDGADRAVLDFDGDGLINVQITGALAQRLNTDEAAVANKGTLQADSGTVVLQASAAKNLFTNLINNTGVINAGGISTSGGVVRLVATGGNTVDSGSINVSGTQGGSVQVLSDQDVGVTGNIDASGTQGGGSIRVGGGYQGGEGLPTATATYVGSSANLDADAIQSGNGGSVVVWGNQVNNFYGDITARGGALSGNGGLVETSSHDGLNAQGEVDASAVHGKAGTWLLDPYDVTISDGSATNVPSITNGNNISYTANGTGSVINASSLSSTLTGGTNIFVFTNTQGTGNESGDITVNSPIMGASSGTGAASLYLEAAGSIFLSSTISAASTSLPLNVYLWANYGGTAAGSTYSSNSACTSLSNCVVNLTGAGITTLGGNVDIETTGAVSIDNNSSISTGAGNITIGSSVAPSSVSLAGTTSAADVSLNSAGAITQSSGDITASGTANITAGGAIDLNSNNNFGGTVNLSNSGANDIVLNNGSNALALGTVTSPGGSLTVSAGGGITIGSSITTGGAQTYNNAVTLGAGSITLTGTSVSLLDGVTGTDTTLTISGNGVLAGTSDLGALSVSGTSTLSGDIMTSGAQTYTGAAILDGNTTLQSMSATGGVTFDSTVDSSGSTPFSLDVNAFSNTLTLGGPVGSVDALSSLTSSGGGVVVLQANVTTSGAQTYTGAVTLGGNITLDSTGAGGGVTFDSTVDNASTTAQSLTVEAQNAGVTFNGAVGSGANGALNSLTTQSSTLVAGALNIGSGGLSVTTTGGAITQSGAFIVQGASTFNAGSNGITLTNGGNDFSGAVNLINSGDNNVTLSNNANALTLGNVTVGRGTLDVSGTSIAQASGDTITQAAGAGAATFNTGSGALTLGNSNNVFTGVVNLTGGTTQIAGTGPLTLGLLTTGALTATSTGALDLGGGTVNGTLIATSNGALTQSSGLTVTGTASFTQNDTTAGSGQNVDLSNAANNFESGVTFAAGTGAQINNLSLTNTAMTPGTLTLPSSVAGNLTLDYTNAALALPSITVGGALIASSGGALTQSGALTVNGTSAFNAASNAITLNDMANDFAGAVSLTGGVTQITSNNALTLGTLNTGALTATSTGALDLGEGTVNGTLIATSNGALTQSSGLTVTGTASFTQNDTTAGSGQNIDLSNAANNFESGVTFAAGTGAQINNLSLTNTAMTPGTLTLPSSVAGNLTLDYTDAALVLPQVVAGGALDVTASGGITLDGNVTTGGAQTYNNAVTLDTSTTLHSTGNGAIDLTSTITGPNDLTINTGGAVTLSGAAQLTGLTSTSGTFSANTLDIGSAGLSVTTTGGAISQTGGFTVTGTSDFNAGNNVIMLNASNAFIGAVSFIGSNVNLMNTTSTTLGASRISGTFGVISSGTLTQSGALSVGGTSNFNAGSNAITLNTAGNTFSGAVTLTGATTQITGSGALTLGTLSTGSLTAISTGALDLGNGIINGSLTAASNGALTQGSSGLTVTGAATFTQNSTTAGAGQDIDLSNANNAFQGTVNFLTGAGAAIGNLSLTNSFSSPGLLTLPASVTGNLTLDYTDAALVLPQVVAGGALDVTASGGITLDGNVTTGGAQTYNNAVTLDTSTTLHSTGNGAIDLTSTITGPNDLTINTGGAVTLSGAAQLTGLTSTSGTFSANTLDIGSAGLSVTTTGGAISQTGAFTVTGSSSFNAGSNAITLTNAGNNFAGAVALTGGTAQISQGTGLTLGALHTGSLTVTSNGALNLGSGSIGGNLSANSHGGAISQGGALTVSGTSNVDAGTGAITLTSGNAFDGAVNLTGSTTQITNAAALTLGTVNTGALTATSTRNLNLGSGTVSGNLAANSHGGTINQTGALSVSGTSNLNSGTGAVTLNNSGNAFDGAVTATGTGVTLTDANNLTIASLTDNANGNVALTAGGTLTVLGISAGSGNIALASNGGKLTTGGTISGGNVTLTGLDGITSNNSITAIGTLTLTSPNGAIDEGSGGSLTAGTLTGSSSGATTLTGSNAIGTLGSFSANGFSLNDDQALTVAGTINGNGSTSLTTITGYLTINSAVNGTATTLNAAGAINEGSSGGIIASTLSGSASGAVTLNGNGNRVGVLGNFSAANFSLINGHALTVNGTINGGTSTTLTTSSGDLTLNGAVNGSTTALSSAGAINEGGGSITAAILTGNSAGATTLNGNNQIGALGNFSANGLSFTDGQTLTVSGSVSGNSRTTLTTTSGNISIDGSVNGTTVALTSAGSISEGSDGVNAGTLTGSSSGATTLTGFNQIGTLGSFSANGFSLTDAQALTVTGPVKGGDTLALTTTSGGITIDGDVSTTSMTLNSAGLLSEGSDGILTASTLSGNADGGTTLNGANKVSTLGDFRSLAGFSFADNETLTLSSLNGSSYTVNAGTSPVSFAITGGSLFQADKTWLYDGTGTWSSTGSIGTEANPIYVTGVTTQYVPLVGNPPAYFYAVNSSGDILSIVGDSVNVPTSLFSSRAQNANNHLDSYIDASVISANYRSFGIVPSGILLPADQQTCQSEQGGSDCPDE